MVLLNHVFFLAGQDQDAATRRRATWNALLKPILDGYVLTLQHNLCQIIKLRYLDSALSTCKKWLELENLEQDGMLDHSG